MRFDHADPFLDFVFAVATWCAAGQLPTAHTFGTPSALGRSDPRPAPPHTPLCNGQIGVPVAIAWSPTRCALPVRASTSSATRGGVIAVRSVRLIFFLVRSRRRTPTHRRIGAHVTLAAQHHIPVSPLLCEPDLRHSRMIPLLNAWSLYLHSRRDLAGDHDREPVSDASGRDRPPAVSRRSRLCLGGAAPGPLPVTFATSRTNGFTRVVPGRRTHIRHQTATHVAPL
jgi:hypothetical protein